MNDRDLVRLRHMLQYAREVVAFRENKDRSDLDNGIQFSRAVSYSTGIIGEAAAHVSPEFRGVNEHIPWRSIIGLRHFLVHEYFQLDHDVLWKVVSEDVPALILELEKLIPPESGVE